MDQPGWRVGSMGGLLLAVLIVAPGSARAEQNVDDRALATVLFHEGRALLTEGRIAEACLKLEESQRLDPSGGTLLNLALCHEQEGRLAHAWTEFNDARALARSGGRRDREQAADEHIGALAPRLSKLTVVVSPSVNTDGLRIECDGRALGRGAWSTPMPIDGGEHVVRATATGKRPFATTIVIGKESDAQTVEIPVLADAPVAAAAEPVPSSSARPFHAPEPVAVSASASVGTGAPRLRRTLAYTVGGAALVQLALAGYFGWRAYAGKCQNESCTGQEVTVNNDAVRAADTATVLTITGVASAVVGTYLFVTSRRPPVSATEPKLTLNISDRGLTIGGRF
jgi:hypothetical protein